MPSSDKPQLNNHTWTFVDSQEKLLEAADSINDGSGPIGIDVERASGFKYFQKAYLLQIFRRDAGIFIFDPLTIDTFDPLAKAIASEEWVLHAAIADLESLKWLGLTPEHLFDTEIASRLLGLERVSLGAITQSLLDTELEKAFSRADWSTRPIPEPWLEYAALDVIYLPDLRDKTHELLEETNKTEFAYQEFDFLLNQPEKPPAAEPWRKLSGYGKLQDPKLKAIARELWIARDELSQKLDLAPTRVLPNSSIIVAASMNPRSAEHLSRNRDFIGKYSRLEIKHWWRAIRRAKITAPVDAPARENNFVPKNIKSWLNRNPEAYERLTAARQLLQQEAERLNIPAENLLPPSVIKAVSWDPPPQISAETISEQLAANGARPWQRDLTAQLIAQSFVETL